MSAFWRRVIDRVDAAEHRHGARHGLRSLRLPKACWLPDDGAALRCWDAGEVLAQPFPISSSGGDRCARADDNHRGLQCVGGLGQPADSRVELRAWAQRPSQRCQQVSGARRASSNPSGSARRHFASVLGFGSGARGASSAKRSSDEYFGPGGRSNEAPARSCIRQRVVAAR